MSKKGELLGHLWAVQKDAEMRAKDARSAIGNNRYRHGGWSDEKWDNYHLCVALEAETVASYCLVRRMQIDPD